MKSIFNYISPKNKAEKPETGEWMKRLNIWWMSMSNEPLKANNNNNSKKSKIVGHDSSTRLASSFSDVLEKNVHRLQKDCVWVRVVGRA